MAKSKAGPGGTYSLLLPIRRDWGVDLGPVRVMELLHSLLGLALLGLTPVVNTGVVFVVVFYLLRGPLSGRGNVMLA